MWSSIHILGAMFLGNSGRLASIVLALKGVSVLRYSPTLFRSSEYIEIAFEDSPRMRAKCSCFLTCSASILC